MTNDKPVLGQEKCTGCGATVEVREDKARKAYYFCDGRVDERACGTRVTFGHRPTKQRKDIAAGKGKGKTEQSKTEEKIDDGNVQLDATEAIDGDDADKLFFE